MRSLPGNRWQEAPPSLSPQTTILKFLEQASVQAGLLKELPLKETPGNWPFYRVTHPADRVIESNQLRGTRRCLI